MTFISDKEKFYEAGGLATLGADLRSGALDMGGIRFFISHHKIKLDLFFMTVRWAQKFILAIMNIYLLFCFRSGSYFFLACSIKQPNKMHKTSQAISLRREPSWLVLCILFGCLIEQAKKK